MKSILTIPTLMLLMSFCSPQHDNIVIVNKSLNRELDSFIDYLIADSFQLKKTVTVIVTPKGDYYEIALINYTPSSCEDLVGILHYKKDFVIHFASDKEYLMLFRVLHDYNCQIEQSENTSSIPLGANYRERFYEFKDDSMTLINMAMDSVHKK